MPVKTLILTLLALLLAVPRTPAGSPRADACPTGLISRTDDRPQWDDLGLTHLLAAGGQSVAPPSPTLRPQHHTPPCLHPAATQAAARHATRRARALGPRQPHSRGYLYLIQCLRL